MSEASPRLSLVMPSYNEEGRIEESLRRVGEFLVATGYPAEVIVVDDGSREPGRKAAEDALSRLPAAVGRSFIRHEVNRGKGAAVRTGCLAARGQYVAFIDADLATPPEDLLPLLDALNAGADVAIGVRNQGDGSDMRNQRSLPRRLAGRAFSLTMRTWLLPGIEDSQCPLKAFKGSAAQRLFRLQKIETWSFDAELLFLASRLGLKVTKIPVRWHAVEGSHLRLNMKSAMELWNLLSIRWIHRGVSSKTLAGEPKPA
ncbi:MAG: glycosyltransferase [Dehalococcoidia bacterium]|nr:glycosyltransferase [Dehalococcoidia bacterium]